jgi:hypothetical protein
MKNQNRFEKDILHTYQLPTPDPAFINQLEKKFGTHPTAQKPAVKPLFKFNRTLGYMALVMLLLIALLFAIGPTEALAQIQVFFGYVPGVGVVETESSLYQLAEPISDTREGITLTITSAYISADQALITFTTPYLPDELLPEKFGDPACHEQASLLFSDGSVIQNRRSQGGIQADGSIEQNLIFIDPPGEKDFSQATLILPCIDRLAEGKGPLDWHFNLAFTPAPEELDIFPVSVSDLDQPVELEPEVRETLGLDEDNGAEEEALTAMFVDGERQEEMTLLGVADKGDSYWVTWAYPMPHDPDIQMNGFLLMTPFNTVLYDANGVEQPQADLERRNELWEYQNSLIDQLPKEDQRQYTGIIYTYPIPKTGFAFPAYIKLNALERSFPEKEAFAEIQFDGTAVQNSEGPVPIHQKIQIGDIEFELVSIEKSEYSGYTFNFDGTEGEVVNCRIELINHPTNFAGQSSLNADDPFHFYQSLNYSTSPTGNLTVRIDLPAVLGDLITLVGTWSPGN